MGLGVQKVRNVDPDCERRRWSRAGRVRRQRVSNCRPHLRRAGPAPSGGFRVRPRRRFGGTDLPACRCGAIRDRGDAAGAGLLPAPDTSGQGRFYPPRRVPASLLLGGCFPKKETGVKLEGHTASEAGLRMHAPRATWGWGGSQQIDSLRRWPPVVGRYSARPRASSASSCILDPHHSPRAPPNSVSRPGPAPTCFFSSASVRWARQGISQPSADWKPGPPTPSCPSRYLDWTLPSRPPPPVQPHRRPARPPCFLFSKLSCGSLLHV